MSSMFDNQKFPTENQEFFGWVVDYIENEGQILYKVRAPNLWGPNVPDEHLQYCAAEMPPSLGGATTSGGALDKGQFVRIKVDHGQGPTGKFTIKSTYHSTMRSNSEMPGNFSWTKVFGDQLSALARIGVKLPPDVQKKINEKGVEVIEILEKGEFHLRDLLGIATHGSQSPFNGIKIPQMKSITTALDAAENALTPEILAKLPGIPFSIPDMFDLLGKDLTKELMDSLPELVRDALMTTMVLSQNYTDSKSMSAIRINPLVFPLKIMELLKGSGNVTELLNNLNKLLRDSTNWGLDSLPQINETISGIFGDINMTILSNGSVVMTQSDGYQKASEAFNSFLGTFENADGTLFDTVPDFAGLVKRLPPKVSQQIKDNVLPKIQQSFAYLKMLERVKS
jgi:hypothetical protein